MTQINTIYGLMDENLLIKKIGSSENEDQYIEWVEYWCNDELVHRSVHLTVKQFPAIAAEINSGE